jgi:Uma2 family endonuclease
MSTDTTLITADEFARMEFPDDDSVELVRGRIVHLWGEDGMVRPGPRHGAVCVNISAIIRDWARSTAAGRVVSNDNWAQTEFDPDTVRGPDVAFYRMERLPEGKVPSDDQKSEIFPDLCVEVLSPSNTKKVIREKRDEYLGAGAEEMWVVDPENRTVEIFREGGRVRRISESEQITSDLLPGFSAAVADFFEGL